MSRSERPALAQRLAVLRQQAGLSQAGLAQRIGVHPSNIGFWELKGTPPRGEILPALARELGVSVDELLGVRPIKARPAGPEGKLRKVFERASKLPRAQQAKVAEFVEAFVERQEKAG
ncbi:MAG: helix-turn-helix domain-containing protein [Opitutaceae bacterium]